MVTIPNSALRLCAARLYYIHDIKKVWFQYVYDETEMVCVSVRYCLFKIVMLQKIKKNKDASRK